MTVTQSVGVGYDAIVELRDGQKVVVITKTTTTTPITGRGKEWRQAIDVTETTVLGTEEARKLHEALFEAVFYAACDPQMVTEREGKVTVTRGWDAADRETVLEAWSSNEAEEAAQRYFAEHNTSAEERASYVIRRADGEAIERLS